MRAAQNQSRKRKTVQEVASIKNETQPIRCRASKRHSRSALTISRRSVQQSKEKSRSKSTTDFYPIKKETFQRSSTWDLLRRKRSKMKILRKNIH